MIVGVGGSGDPSVTATDDMIFTDVAVRASADMRPGGSIADGAVRATSLRDFPMDRPAEVLKPASSTTGGSSLDVSIITVRGVTSLERSIFLSVRVPVRDPDPRSGRAGSRFTFIIGSGDFDSGGTSGSRGVIPTITGVAAAVKVMASVVVTAVCTVITGVCTGATTALDCPDPLIADSQTDDSRDPIVSAVRTYPTIDGALDGEIRIKNSFTRGVTSSPSGADLRAGGIVNPTTLVVKHPGHRCPTITVSAICIPIIITGVPKT